MSFEKLQGEKAISRRGLLKAAAAVGGQGNCI